MGAVVKNNFMDIMEFVDRVVCIAETLMCILLMT